MSLPEKPLTRRELYLAKAAGQDVTLPETDLTREEMYLREIANGGGGDVTKEYVDNAIANAVADIDDDISALSDTVADKVDKVNGKGLSTNDYTDADKALVQDSPITVTATASPISTANGKPRKLTVYGKSEVINGAIVSAGEGYAVVDLGTLTWTSNVTGAFAANLADSPRGIISLICSKYPYDNSVQFFWDNFNNYDNKTLYRSSGQSIYIKDTDYTTESGFIASLGDATLCYQLADPSQGNAIAIKTDNGTGIAGTMATFTTGTPLYGVSADIRDVMQWNGSAGEVTKNCAKVRLADLTWNYSSGTSVRTVFATTSIVDAQIVNSRNDIPMFLCSAKTSQSYNGTWTTETITQDTTGAILCTADPAITTVTDFVASLGDAELIYELATPTTQPLTQTENESIAGLKTYSPQTAITINDNPEFEVEAYANTANGQVISDMQTIVSPLLTLSASGWTNNAQTVTYEHDTGKRNSIDVEPANIKAWTAAGILATAETATSITFECDTTPTSDLSFRVTSMEVR